jgi:hypothetical protein
MWSLKEQFIIEFQLRFPSGSGEGGRLRHNNNHNDERVDFIAGLGVRYISKYAINLLSPSPSSVTLHRWDSWSLDFYRPMACNEVSIIHITVSES